MLENVWNGEDNKLSSKFFPIQRFSSRFEDKPLFLFQVKTTFLLLFLYSIPNIVNHRLHVCLHEEEEQQAAGLQQVVKQVELHRDHVPLPPPRLGGLAQPHHILVL